MPIDGNHFSGCTASFQSIAASSSAWIEFNVDSWRRTAREFYLCRWPVVRSHPVITQKTPHSDSEHSLSATLFSSCKIRLTFNWIISTWLDDLLFGIIQQLPVQHMMWIGFRHLTWCWGRSDDPPPPQKEHSKMAKCRNITSLDR